MEMTLGVLMALYALGVRPGGIWPGRWFRTEHGRTQPGSAGIHIVIYADGPIAGHVGILPTGTDGLPPLHVCAFVPRSARRGGAYTMPYQRSVIREAHHAWSYTRGWTERNEAHLPIEEWTSWS